jgi:hypothetical protein
MAGSEVCLKDLEYANKITTEINNNLKASGYYKDTPEGDEQIAKAATLIESGKASSTNQLIRIDIRNLITIKLIILLIVNFSLIYAFSSSDRMTFGRLFQRMITPNNKYSLYFYWTFFIISLNEFQFIQWRGMYIIHLLYIAFVLFVIFFHKILSANNDIISNTFNSSLSLKTILVVFFLFLFIMAIRDLIIIIAKLPNQLMVDWFTDLPSTVSYERKNKEFLDTFINIITLFYLIYGFISVINIFAGPVNKITSKSGKTSANTIRYLTKSPTNLLTKYEDNVNKLSRS